jgi:hypothetical protein
LSEFHELKTINFNEVAMARETAVVLNITSEIGHMMDDATYCPPSATQADIMEFFKTLILEQGSSYTLKNSDINAMTHDINDYFEGVTKSKNKLIAEESSEAAMDLVVAAATIAAEAGSWIPLVNFGLAATAIAATATALALEVESEKLEKTVVEEISDSDSRIIKQYNSFENLKTYSSAVTANTLFYPRLQLGATIKQMRALFIGVIVIIKKSNKGLCSAEDMKKTFVDYYNATRADPELVDKFIEIMQELDEGGDPEKFKEDIAAFFKPLPDAVVRGYASIMLSFATSIAIRKGAVAYKAYRAALAAAPPMIELDELDAEGNVVKKSGAPAAEAETLSTAEIGVRAMAVLAAVASVVFAGLEIAKAVDTDKKLTKAISDAKSGITNYYTALVNRTVDGDVVVPVVEPLLGAYESHKYDNTEYKNNWHYVTISKVDDTTLKWSNRAGVSWTLKTTFDKTKLHVSQDCPYYNFNDGTIKTQYTEATVVWNGDKVSGILGPWNETYEKSAT